MDEELYFLMDDTYELEHRDCEAPVISEELSQRMTEVAEAILFGTPTDTKAA